MDSYRFLSSSLVSLFKTFVDVNHKSPITLKKEIVDIDEIIRFVDEIGEVDRTIFGFKKDYPDEIQKTQEALNNDRSDIFLKFLEEVISR